MDLVGKPAQILGETLEVADQRFGLRTAAPQDLSVENRGRQALVEIVVKLAGDPPAFLFTGLQQHPCQATHLAASPLQVGAAFSESRARFGVADAEQEPPGGMRAGRDTHLYGELRAVLAALPPHAAPTLGGSRLFRERFFARSVEKAQRTPHRLLGGVAVKLRGGAVPTRHAAARVEGDDGVVNRVENREQLGVGDHVGIISIYRTKAISYGPPTMSASTRTLKNDRPSGDLAAEHVGASFIDLI